MANQRPAHRKGTTGRAYRKAQAHLFNRSKTCARCGGPFFRQPCDPAEHPHHAKLPYCPTNPLAPSLGHIQDLQFGGSVLDPRNHRAEHYGCNARAGVEARWAATKGKSAEDNRQSWEW